MVKKLVASLNADARIIACDQADVPLDAILDTGLFDEEKASQHPLWAKELYGYTNHVPETEEYGIESFVYRARTPFDPAKFHSFLIDGGLDHVVRAKGHFWLATRPDWVGELAVAGNQTLPIPVFLFILNGLRKQLESPVSAPIYISRVKAIKRQMYGRAGLPLLRQRVLLAA